jgi:hypothetical protein
MPDPIRHPASDRRRHRGAGFVLGVMFVVLACSFVERASPLIQLRFKKIGAEPIRSQAFVPQPQEAGGT